MKKINKPIKHGIARKTPVVMQLEALECGAACLTMVLAYYDKWVPLEQVRSDCGVSRDGSCAKNIIKAARYYGLQTKAYNLEPEDLDEYAIYPAIIHWNFDHFVVLKGINKKYAYINDPARGDIKVPISEFDESFTGVCMMFEPGEDFVPSGKKKSTFDYVSERILGLGPVIIFVLLTTCITSLMSIISPGFTRVFYDVLLERKNPEWIIPFFIGLTAFSLVQILVQWLTAVYSLKINGKMSVIGSTSFMWKVLRLPMDFFSQRMVGDVLSRERSNVAISNTIVNILAPLIINALMMVFYFIVMIRYNVVLTIVALVTTFLNMLMSTYITKKRMNASRIQLRDAGKLESTKMSGIESIETIKASGAEDGFFGKWAGYQASANNGSIEYETTTNYLGLVPNFVSTLCSVTIITIGLYLTMKGEFTLGMITAFQAYLASFLGPVNSLINAGQTLQEMQNEMERIDDVMKYPIDYVFDQSDDLPVDSYAKLSGNIEIKDVTFGYAKLADPIIKNFSLSLKPGSRVALVGESGCGKSTIAKMICGLNQPWSGEITFDGKHINEIDRSIFTGSVAVVDQDIILFEDSINNNIKMWDESIADFEVVMASRDAQIHSDIVVREGGYNYKLSEGGKDFSGGQRQRLEIARVLAQDPTICILDEATSALDAKTEYDVIEAIKNRGITCIIVAHRLSTIRDCDEIIVLDHGCVVERGTHDELMKNNGYYTKLITND